MALGVGERSLWVCAIESRYESFRWVSEVSSVSKKWSLWCKDLYELWWSPIESLFFGEWGRVRFWFDSWIEDRCWLMDRFPSFFELSLQKEELVGRVWHVCCESWVFQWVREFNTNEFIEFVEL